MKNSKKNMDYVKASRKGSRDAELENSSGFKSTHKVHKSQKQYSRKSKYKDDYLTTSGY